MPVFPVLLSRECRRCGGRGKLEEVLDVGEAMARARAAGFFGGGRVKRPKPPKETCPGCKGEKIETKLFTLDELNEMFASSRE
jgi:DnaJ-class molecular chaperone